MGNAAKDLGMGNKDARLARYCNRAASAIARRDSLRSFGCKSGSLRMTSLHEIF